MDVGVPWWNLVYVDVNGRWCTIVCPSMTLILCCGKVSNSHLIITKSLTLSCKQSGEWSKQQDLFPSKDKFDA